VLDEKQTTVYKRALDTQYNLKLKVSQWHMSSTWGSANGASAVACAQQRRRPGEQTAGDRNDHQLRIEQDAWSGHQAVFGQGVQQVHPAAPATYQGMQAAQNVGSRAANGMQQGGGCTVRNMLVMVESGVPGGQCRQGGALGHHMV
jgi:hypothetical protein